MESAKDRKVKEAKEFFSRIRVRNSLFIGISGSVSYEPREEDDIDIFLIARNKRLWSSILEILVFRRIYRFSDLCLSLCMDDSFAITFFANLEDGLAARDSKQVIPISGEEYFKNLLKTSPVITSNPNQGDGYGSKKSNKSNPFMDIVEWIPFLFVSSWINVKAIYNGHKDRKSGLGGFKTMFSMHSFYFDTDKYHQLNEKYIKGEILNEENRSDI
ncbi:MAG: hypothetical protein QXU18_00985 [Thermoplasmatales archaeon]